MTSQTLSLLVLGKLGMQIEFLSRRTFVKNLGMSREDLVQEGRLKVITIVNGYKKLPMRELVALCSASLTRFYGGLVRRNFRDKNMRIEVDLSELYYLEDKNSIEELFVNLQITQLYELFDGDEKIIFDCLMDPPEELVMMAIEYRKGRKTEVKITHRLIAQYLEISQTKIHRIFEGIRMKAIPVLEVQ